MDEFIAFIVSMIFFILVGIIVGFSLRDNNTLPKLDKANIGTVFQLDSGDCKYYLKDYNVAFIDKCGHQIGDKLKVVGSK